MENLIYNPKLKWHLMPESIEYIKILQEQGVSTFDPVKFYNEAKIQKSENIDVNNLSKKDRKKIKKNKISKSAQTIIDNNNRKKELILKEEEDRKLNFLIEKSNDIESMSKMIDQMNTKYGKIKSKLLLLKNSMNKNLNLETHLLFFALNSIDPPNELKNLYDDIINLYKRKFKESDLIEIQMIELSSYLHPLNPLNKFNRKLDDWQVEVFQKIESKENILIIAPTSAGKTVCSTYCAIIGNKTLFVVPSNELARQVAGIFRNMSNIRIGIITNKEYYMDEDVNVIVGTPSRLEEFLTLHLYEEDICNFDYVIYDEIQMLNCEEGEAFENIIKLLQCPFLALSATIEKPQELKNWLELIKNKPVHLVEYNKRFIVQQRYLWKDNNLNHLHPISCVDIDFISSDEFLKSELSFTPRDTYHIYNTIKDKIGDCPSIKPHNILSKDKWDQIDLNDTIIVEKHVKNFLRQLAIENKDKLNEILEVYKADEEVGNIDIVKLIKVLISKNMCPAIFFKLDSFKCRIIFKYIVTELEKQQNEKYPHHYDDLGMIYDAFKSFNSDWENEQEKIKIPKDIDPNTFKENIKKRLSDKSLNSLKQKYRQVINSRNAKINDSETISETQKQFYIDYYSKELNKVLELDELIFVDKNMPHPEFTFNYMGIDSNIMRGIRKNLKNALGYDVKYTHPIMIGIERGIVPYFRDMETPFQRLVQSLFSQKRIPIIISDESLGYGINMPIRTVIMLGEDNYIEKIDTLKASQMSGRSGRRGVDREGNIVYAGVNWKTILRGRYAELIGKNPISFTLPLPIYFKKLKGSDVDRLFGLSLYQYTKQGETEINNKANIMTEFKKNKILKSEFFSELIWTCRYLDNNIVLLPDMLKYLARKNNVNHFNIFIAFVVLFDRNGKYNNDLEHIPFETNTLYNSNELMTIYREKRIINTDKTQDILNRLKLIAFSIAAIDTAISKTKFNILDNVLNETFLNIKNIIVKYQF